MGGNGPGCEYAAGGARRRGGAGGKCGRGLRPGGSVHEVEEDVKVQELTGAGAGVGKAEAAVSGSPLQSLQSGTSRSAGGRSRDREDRRSWSRGPTPRTSDPSWHESD